MAVTQAIRVLTLMFCSPESSSEAQLGVGGDAAVCTNGKAHAEGNGASVAAGAQKPSVPKSRMVSKALSLLLNKAPEDGPLAGPSAMAAALELLLRLSSMRSMCLNLLFSTVEESVAEGSPAGWPVPVIVSCAFRLHACGQRLARELSAADEGWVATERGSEAEAEAEDALAAWLHAGELLVNLCQTVLVNCPTASVFLAVVLPTGSPPENVDEAMLRGVLADVHAVLGRITGRTQRA
eukprot:CAMPEP_0168464548 /NCGR_PEP_ID=MMETSP0228-20121227/55636_1 /TAXON_ID=133427 /ORGANISM="Protoceratium reticulatum, Strain CCCM 535 (=CCMP 1889)" /LENGTH=237 /DNA_ID=CAMNT_0008480055 /DNA_START=75 /DNA_END=785 /DNA_ORIENTATION=-